MSTARVRVRFDGPSLADHRMDVRELGQSFLGLGDLFHEANRIFNDQRTHVKVVITPDVQTQCIDFNFEVYQTIVEAAQSLLIGVRAMPAGEIVDWILRGTEGGGIICGLIYWMRHRKGKKIKDVTEFLNADGEVLYRIQYHDNDLPDILAAPAFKLASSSIAQKSVAKLVSPAAFDEGIESVVIYDPEHKKTRKQKVVKQEAKQIAEDINLDVSVELPPQDVEAFLRVYSPVYDSKRQNGVLSTSERLFTWISQIRLLQRKQ